MQNSQNYFSFLKTLFPLIRGTEGGLESRKALAALVLFVGRRYYLRPIIRRSDYWNARSATGTALGQWNARRATGTEPLAPPGTPAGLIAATRAHVCNGNAMNVR